jgi:hypothetical protein
MPPPVPPPPTKKTSTVPEYTGVNVPVPLVNVAIFEPPILAVPDAPVTVPPVAELAPFIETQALPL